MNPTRCSFPAASSSTGRPVWSWQARPSKCHLGYLWVSETNAFKDTANDGQTCSVWIGPVNVTCLAFSFPKARWVPKSHEHDAGLQLAEENVIPLLGSSFFFMSFFLVGLRCLQKNAKCLPVVFQVLTFGHVGLLSTSTHLSAVVGWQWKGPSEGWWEGAVPPKSVRNDSCSHDSACVSRHRALQPAHLTSHKSQKQKKLRKEQWNHGKSGTPCRLLFMLCRVT